MSESADQLLARERAEHEAAAAAAGFEARLLPPNYFLRSDALERRDAETKRLAAVSDAWGALIDKVRAERRDAPNE